MAVNHLVGGSNPSPGANFLLREQQKDVSDMIEFALWLLLSIVIGVVASSKGRSGIGYFLLSFFLSPLIGLIIVLVLGPKEQSLLKKGIVKKCPFCAELVKHEAIVCKFCGRTLTKSSELQ